MEQVIGLPDLEAAERLEAAIQPILDGLPPIVPAPPEPPCWPADSDRADRTETAPTECAPIVSLFNPLRPSIIAVVDPTMRDAMTQIEPELVRRMFDEPGHPRPWLLVLSDCEEPAVEHWRQQLPLPPEMPIVATRLDTTSAIGIMGRLLDQRTNPGRARHGVFMEVSGAGVLITGEAGVGKSELALELITRGHRLIADDAPIFRRIGFDIVEGHCPERLLDLLEVRGIGLINVREMYGDAAIKRSKYLRLIVHLVPEARLELSAEARLEGFHGKVNVCGLDMAQTVLPVAPGRNLAVMVEAVVRQHNLIRNGYSLDADLRARGIGGTMGPD